MSTLKESQAKLDKIQEAIIANKQAREALRTEAVALRESYIAEEAIREALLKAELSGGTE